MSDLTAIDVLVDPDEKTRDHARAWNARMRESVPDGFALDASHQPHITALQRYVRTAELARSTGWRGGSPLRSERGTPPHVTVGFATLDDLDSIETESFDAFDVHPTGPAVYQLGTTAPPAGSCRAGPARAETASDGGG